jgi:hypothetical protein
MLRPNGASYYLMDACALDFPAASFDAVVDKGTLDAMLSIDGDETQSWYTTHAHDTHTERLMWRVQLTSIHAPHGTARTQLLEDAGGDRASAQARRALSRHIRT